MPSLKLLYWENYQNWEKWIEVFYEHMMEYMAVREPILYHKETV